MAQKRYVYNRQNEMYMAFKEVLNNSMEYFMRFLYDFSYRLFRKCIYLLLLMPYCFYSPPYINETTTIFNIVADVHLLTYECDSERGNGALYRKQWAGK
jgi:hypothetical protein